MQFRRIIKILMLLFSLIVIWLSASSYLNSLVCMKYEAMSSVDISSIIVYEEIMIIYGIISLLYFIILLWKEDKNTKSNKRKP